MSSIRVALTVVVSLAMTGVASAAVPKPNASLEAHQHGTGGHDWHVELAINATSTRLATVVLYAQECGETTFAEKVPIAADGSFAVDGNLPKGAGTWFVRGRFVDSVHAKGIWSVTKGACVTGDRPFEAHNAAGDSHGAHMMRGNLAEYPPAAIMGPSKNARRLRRLQRAGEKTKPRFDTLKEAAKLGYVLDPLVRSRPNACPGTWHARKHGTLMWGRFLDPAAPQALIYWCDAQRHWTLAAYMYRAPGDSLPNTFGNLMQWHRHGATAAWMVHVWLVPDVRAAFATCVSFQAFERFSIFSYERYKPDAMPDLPCSDTDRHKAATSASSAR
jgi:hypothetical protein